MQDQPFDVVLWDWNGTLLDDGEFGLSIINGMLRRRGLREPEPEEHRQLFDFPVSLYYGRLGFDFQRERFETVSQEFVDAYIAGAAACPLKRGAREILEALQASGFRQSVLSASRQDYLERFIRHHGLEGYFEELLGIDSVHAPGKVERGCAWIETFGIDPARVLLVGDTMHDAKVADKMGIDCWLVDGGHHGPERLRETGRPCHPDLDSIREALLPSRLRPCGA